MVRTIFVLEIAVNCIVKFI